MTADTDKPSTGEWIAAAAVVAAVIAISRFVGLSHKWENAFGYTAGLFCAVLVSTRPVWGKRMFWQNLIAIFLLHCIILGAIEQSLPVDSAGPRGLPLIGAGLAELIFIVIVLWRKSVGSGESGAGGTFS